jgi:ParB/RepB/Spo0J family partition protein
MSDPQRLGLAELDRRFASLRLTAPQALRSLRVSIEREGIRHPVLVSSAVEPQRWVLLDGFKRVRIAEELQLGSVWARSLALDAASSTAAILQANQAQQGLSEVEQAWIVHALCREHGMKQAAVGELLGRDKSWVCRRLQLAESLETSLQEDLRLGLLSGSVARELARLPRGNQLRAAQAVRDHELTHRQTVRLIERLKGSDDPSARREVLADPLRFIGAEPCSPRAAVSDPRLGEQGNRLRRWLLSWEGISNQLTRTLSRNAPASVPLEEARVLSALIHRALASARRTSDELAALERDTRACGHG